MKPNRRQVLAGAAAAVALGPQSVLAAGSKVLRAAPAMAQIAPPEFAQTPVWAFDGTAPGPVLRYTQGARLQRQLVNALPQPTAVHWHGIRIDNAMDGVPDLTQSAVPPGESFDYDFVLPDAGTYWYHSHNQSMEQVARGLSGALIVDEATDGPALDGERVWLLDDWRLDPESIEIHDSFGAFHDLSHAGRIGNIVTTNGTFELTDKVRAGDRLRLRLINAANARIFELGLQGLRGWIVALDGMPLARPRPVPDRFALAPAQRVDLIVDVIAGAGEPAHLLRHEREGAISQVWIEVAEGTTPRVRAAPQPLPPNPDFGAPEMRDARAVGVLMQGGAMRGMAGGAEYRGRKLDMRALAREGMFWALNGQADRNARPLFRASRGETVRIAFANDTAFPHAMHLHGHHFHLVGEDGRIGDLRDTILVDAGRTAEVALRCHNPGKWLFHCHMLGHAAAGMMTWYEVS